MIFPDKMPKFLTYHNYASLPLTVAKSSMIQNSTLFSGPPCSFYSDPNRTLIVLVMTPILMSKPFYNKKKQKS